MNGLRTAHLFAGGGGGLLADLILGHEPLLAVEWDKSCCRSLRARVREGWLPQDLHIHCLDVREFDFSPWAGSVDCISAGFPCQDISCAGTGEGITGARSSLVWEVFRAIDAIRPGLVFLENSPEIRKKGRRDIIRALVERGYSWRDGTLAAATVGAGHKRDRWWLLAANADGHLKLEQERRERKQWGWFGDRDQEVADVDGDVQQSREKKGRQKIGRTGNSHQASAHALQCGQQEIWRGKVHTENNVQASWGAETSSADNLCQQLQIAVQRGGLSETSAATVQAAARYTGAYHWSPPDTGICGMVDGLAVEMDGCSKGARIKACGNGQVPLAAAAAFIILSGGAK